jgi:hypothetical protein
MGRTTLANYEKILLNELGLHHLRTPNEVLVPGQVQIRRSGQPFGRFTLDDVFEGDFSGVAALPEARMADIERTSSNAYSLDATGDLTGPLSWIARARSKVEAAGARHVQLTAVTGTLTEIDQGALQRALNNAVVRSDGPMTKRDVAIVIIAVAKVKDFSVRFNDEKGGRVEISVDAAQGLIGEVGLSAAMNSSAGLTFSLEAPIPFAARVWRVERRLTGKRLNVGTFRGPVQLLGEQPDQVFDAEFAKAVGLTDGAIEL